jgi:hypothetical protein
LDDTDVAGFVGKCSDVKTSPEGRCLPYVVVSGKVAAAKGAKLLESILRSFHFGRKLFG